MKWVLLLMLIVIIIVALVVTLTIMKIKAGKQEIPEFEALPYFKKDTLLNEVEQILFQRLIQAAPGYHVMAQVRLAELIGVKKSENWKSWFNKIQSKSVDFVICGEKFEILLVIELDGKTHDREDRQHADRTKDEALKAAELNILRIKADKMPSVEELRKILLE